MEGQRKLKWRLRELMLQENLRSAAQLSRLLKKQGINLTPTQMARIVYQGPKRVSIEFLEALITIFKCDLNELLEVETENTARIAAISEEAKESVRKRAHKPETWKSILGNDSGDKGNTGNTDEKVVEADGLVMPVDFDPALGPYKITSLKKPRLVKTVKKKE